MEKRISRCTECGACLEVCPTYLTTGKPHFSPLGRLQAAGHRALLAGGCVRDGLLGRTPRDYDVATSALPGEVMALFSRVVPVGERFGVVQVQVGGHPVEVATFRRDCIYRDGRRPDAVVFTKDAREDAPTGERNEQSEFFTKKRNPGVDESSALEKDSCGKNVVDMEVPGHQAQRILQAK